MDYIQPTDPPKVCRKQNIRVGIGFRFGFVRTEI